jgi:inositol-phosphate phosphatase/L-galactose 1-phosphate phosphatase/histidinol-phosphatase
MSAAVSPDIIAFAHRLADAAREVVRPWFRRPIEVAYKGDARGGISPVTEADRAVETRLREMIAAEYPSHGVIGEEHGADRADAEEVWVLDPIDGTRLFINGLPLFNTLVSYARDGSPLLGVIDQPIMGDRWIGGAGLATTFNGKPVRTRACAGLSGAVLCTSSPAYYQGKGLEHDLAAFERLRGAVSWTQYGVDSYGLGLIASGCMDLGLETEIYPHDFCALAPVIEGAGGVITDWHGERMTLGSEGRIIASGDPALHGPALAVLAAT